jgi:hypothetical protein
MKLVVIVGNGNQAEVVCIYEDRKQCFNELLNTETAFACRRPPEI